MEARERQFQIQKCVVKTIQDEKRVVGERQRENWYENLSASSFCYIQALSQYTVYTVSFLHFFVCLFLSV